MSDKVAKKAKTITYSSYPIGWNKLKDLGWLKYKYIYIYKIFKKKKKKGRGGRRIWCMQIRIMFLK